LIAKCMAENLIDGWENALMNSQCSVRLEALQGLTMDNEEKLQVLWRARNLCTENAQLKEMLFSLVSEMGTKLQQLKREWGDFALEVYAKGSNKSRAESLVVMSIAFGLPPIGLLREHAAVGFFVFCGNPLSFFCFGGGARCGLTLWRWPRETKITGNGIV